MITTAAASSTTSKPRLRSLTPSAEKLRVSTLHQQQVKVVANGNESSMDQVRLLITPSRRRGVVIFGGISLSVCLYVCMGGLLR